MNRLKENDVIAYAERAANILGMKLPPKEWMLRWMEAKIPIPILLENETAQLWIDPYYIAYSRGDKKEIHYPYLTEYHIAEERESYQYGLRRGRITEGLPAEIERIFEAAQSAMKRAGREYIIDRDFFLGAR
jgi:hypothetical protein